jgi:hypothetical protein
LALSSWAKARRGKKCVSSNLTSTCWTLEVFIELRSGYGR